MTKSERLQELLQIFYNHRYPIKTNDLLHLVEYSRPTLNRYIKTLRDLGAPLRFDQKAQGYILDKTDDAAFQLPGLWFNVSELQSLLVINELIDQLDPGLLKIELTPLRNAIENRLAARGVKTEELSKRFLFLGVGIRFCCPQAFKASATAVMDRKRLKLQYRSRGSDVVTNRQVSPQKLIYYKNNWYLAAYCHKQKALRSLALERISDIVALEKECIEIEENELHQHFTSSFGIFAGQPEQQAVLRFSRESARWVADERWHADQQYKWLPDGTYELCLPYSDERELVMEILRYGPEVQVIQPESLRLAIQEKLEQALKKYEKK